MRNLFETVISVKRSQRQVLIPEAEDNADGLNYLAGKDIQYVNQMAELGTMLAHVDGGVPNIGITIPEINEDTLGQLIYFFEVACGLSGYVLGINPFDQPGVEAYKKNMFALLGKPGFEEETEKIRKRLGV
jgi:glucose-6-phosphate isomerase